MDIEKRHNRTFEAIRQTTDDGREFWDARDLQIALDYTEWRNFEIVIKKAIAACKNANYEPKNHFVEVNKMVEIGSGAKREKSDVTLGWAERRG